MRVYTDASTRGGISGLGYVATTARDKELYSHGIIIDQSDNNTAELLAIIYAIDDTQDLLQKNEKVTILTDSTYAIQAIRFNNYRKNEEAIINGSIIVACLGSNASAESTERKLWLSLLPHE